MSSKGKVTPRWTPTRTGKVRASVKRLLMKKLEQRAVRSRGK